MTKVKPLTLTATQLQAARFAAEPRGLIEHYDHDHVPGSFAADWGWFVRWEKA